MGDLILNVDYSKDWFGGNLLYLLKRMTQRVHRYRFQP